jgi:hypothetical protein
MRIKATIVVLVFLLSSCAGSSLQNRADQATYEAIAPEYQAYVTADPKLSEVQKARRIATVSSWRRRIEASAPASTPR